jgi:hypothetical protein
MMSYRQSKVDIASKLKMFSNWVDNREHTLFGPWKVPTSIDIAVYEGGHLIRSFTDPNYLNLKYENDYGLGILDLTVTPQSD